MNTVFEKYLHHPQMRRVAALKEPSCNVGEVLESYGDLLDKVGRVCLEVIAPNAASVDAEGARFENGEVVYARGTRENLKACRDAGLWGLSMPREMGGGNIPVPVFLMASEMVSSADASFQNIWNLQSCMDIIYEFGSEDQKERFIPRICAGEMMSMDLTEFESGSDLQSLSLKAEYDEVSETWRLNGVKRFITNGNADIHLVLARSEEGTTDSRGLSMFIYDRSKGGMTIRRIENKMGIHGSPTCEIEFKDAPAELCGQRKLGLIKYVMSLMNAARLGVAAQSVGVCRRAFEEACPYARERRQFGTAICDIPAVAEMLAEMKSRTLAAASLLYRTARYVDIAKSLDSLSKEHRLTDEEKAEYRRCLKLADALTPIVKGMASEYANRNAYDAVQVFGGSGYMVENAVQRLYRDARIFSIYEGTTQMQVTAAMRYILNSTYLAFAEQLLDEISATLPENLLSGLRSAYEDCSGILAVFRSAEDQLYLSRRVYDAFGSLIMAVSLAEDAVILGDTELLTAASVYYGSAAAQIKASLQYVGTFQPSGYSAVRDFIR